MPPLKNDEFVAVFVPTDTDFPGATAIEIGVLYSVDYLPTGKATPQQLLNILKDHARMNGANALKITEIKSPKMTTDPDKVVATMYKIDSVRKYERVIFWSNDRKLNWDDFKGKPVLDTVNHLAAHGVADFIFQMERVYTTSKMNVYISTIFACQYSWVWPDSLQAQNALAFQQLKFDLTEVYARQCRLNFAKSGFNEVRDPDAARKAFHKIYLDYLDELEACSLEINYGRNHEKFRVWRKRVDDQLELLLEYSSH